MGNFLKHLGMQGDLKTSCLLINMSLAKIRELHGGYKSICDNFAINLTEFETIFSSSERMFAIWDTDNNGLIDALELFAGLIIFADSKAEDKIRFIFDLFDFNQIQSVSVVDLEFAIQCILVSTSKIFAIGTDISEVEITALIRSSFQDGIRVTLAQILKWAAISDEVRLFYTMLRMEGPEMISMKTFQADEFVVYEKYLHQLKDERNFPSGVVQFVSKQAAQLTMNRRALNFRAWLFTALQPLVAFRLENKTIHNYLRKPNDLKVKLEWVYGIRTADVRCALQYTVGELAAESTGHQSSQYEQRSQYINEELIYFVSSTVILFNPAISHQRHYTHHDQEVISCTISNINGSLVATGELGQMPAIHVWNSRTLASLQVIKGVHSKGIHLLAFSHDDRMLVTCGLTNPCACIIYEWETAEIVISTAISSPAQEIFVLPEIAWRPGANVYGGMDGLGKLAVEEGKNAQGKQGVDQNAPDQTKSGIVVLSLREIAIFTIRDRSFSQSYVPLTQARQDTTSTPICGIGIIADYKNNYFAMLDIPMAGQRHIYLTGHQDGKVLLWRSDQYIGVLADYKDEIVVMSRCFEGVAIATIRGFIHVWDVYLSQCMKSIELSSFPFKLLSFHVVSMDYNKKRLLVCTIAGDAVEITLDYSHSNRIRAKRLNALVKINGSQQAMTILDQLERAIMIAGENGVVLTFDMATKELIDVWQVGAKVNALASLSLEEGGFVVAAGTVDGNLIIRQDWEEIIPRHHQCGHKPITDCCFSHNGALIAVGSSDKHIYFFQFQDGDFVKLAASRLDNGFPVALSFSEDSKRLVICTNQRKLLLLDPATFQPMFRVEDLSQCYWSTWLGRYPLVTKSASSNLLPISLGNYSNLVAAGDDFGNVYFWKDPDSVKPHIGVNILAHQSPIQRLELTKDDSRVVTLGASDLSVMQWKVTPVEEKELESGPMQRAEPKMPERESNQPQDQQIVLEDDSLINELNFCYQSVSQDSEIRDDNSVLIRGCNNQTVNRILAKLNFDYDEKTWKRPPAVGLVMEHIYGAQLSDRRGTVMYIHFTTASERDNQHLQMAGANSITQMLNLEGQQNARLDQVLPGLLQENYSRIMGGQNAQDGAPGLQNPASLLSSMQPKYDVVHQLCQKQVVYFTSRFPILYNPAKNSQRFYQGHQWKISCITRHPTKRLIASGEVNVNPSVHVWDASSLETEAILHTSHKGGVLQLAFSNDGEKLISIGMDKTFTVQVFQWKQLRTLAFRSLGFLPVFDIKFDPYSSLKFITCGYEHMAVWKLKGTHLTCSNFQRFYSAKSEKSKMAQEEEKQEEQPINEETSAHACLISMDFFSYKLGHTIQSDALFGTSLGEITTFCSGRHFVLNENAHSAAINCIKVSDRLTSDNVNIITGGEDGLIKVWDSAVQLLQVIDVRMAKVLLDLKNPRSYAVQSLDMYCCDRKQPRRLIIGVRCGEILEATITDRDEANNDINKDHYQMLTKNIKRQRIPAVDANLAFEFFTFVSAHSSLNMSQNQKKTFVAVYPLYPIMASVGDDETLRLWDMQKKQLILSKSLGTQASALAFSRDGSFLVIGLVNGVMLVLESKIEQLQFGTYLQEYTLPALEVIMSPKVSRASIVTLKFSYKGDYLAVSFNNEYNEDQIKEELEGAKLNLNENPGQPSEQQKKNDIGSREPGFVIIYVNRRSLKNPGIKVNSEDPYVQLRKIVPPLADYQSSSYLRSLLAVTTMDFSEDDEFLQMCIQRVNSEGVRYRNKVAPADDPAAVRDIVILWHIGSSSIVSDFESMRNTSWPDWSMAATINARLQGTEIDLQNLQEERELLYRELVYMSHVSRFGLLDDAICGSQEGGLYLFRFMGLTIEKLKVIDFKFDFIRKKEMAATRGYYGHTSMIQNIEIYEDRQVLTTSLKDQCIIQWKVEYEDMHWELDFNNVQSELSDPYMEVPNKVTFNKFVNEIWSQRLAIPEISQGINKKEYEDSACELELEYIIGRRAYDRRNNIGVDCLDRIVYIASSLMVFMEENSQPEAGPEDNQDIPKIKQTFLRPEKSKFEAVSPEISCFCISRDNRLLFVASAQSQANIFVWEVTTNVQLGQMTIPNMPIILHIKVAYDNKHLLIVGLTKEYFTCIMMLDWTTQKVFVVRQLLHSLVYKIKDIDFYPGSTRKFVTCGIQHMCFWQLSGANLEYQVGELTIPKAYSNQGGGINQNNQAGNVAKWGLALVSDQYAQHQFTNQKVTDDDLENIYVSFLAMCFIKDTLITCGDDGYLYLWDKVRIVRRIFGHEGSIFALNCNAKLGLIVSGGVEGIVTLWRLLVEAKSTVKSLERLKIFNLRRNVETQAAVQSPEFNVQSVCLGYNRVIVGMRTGSIQEVQISEDSHTGSSQHDLHIKKWIRTNDNEKPKSVGIDTISSRIFMLTSKGLFTVYDLKSFDVVFHKHFGRGALRLHSFRLSNRVMIVFEHDIMVMETDPLSNTFDELIEYRLALNTITYATMNQNERLLGVATISAAAPEVTLYSAEGPSFQILKQIFGFKSTIRYLDFSTDNYYMQVEDQVGEVTLYEIETSRPIQQDVLDFELEWLGPGLRNYQRLKGVHRFYNPNNQIVQVRKVLGKPIIVIGDDIGTLRLYNYPNVQGDPYYQCYSEHLYSVNDCLFSQDNQFFITACEVDKCIFKWRLKYNEKKIATLIEQDRNMLQ